MSIFNQESIYKKRLDYHASHSGFSVTEGLVSVMLVGVVTVGLSNLMGQAFKRVHDLKEKEDRVATGNYLLQFTDCDKTMADPKFEDACTKNLPVNLRDKDDNIILTSNGSRFDQLNVYNRCDGGAIFIGANTDKAPSVIPLLGGVPILCVSKIPPEFKNPVTMTINFVSVGKNLSITAVFVAKSVTTEPNGRRVAEMAVVEGSLKSVASGDFPEELARQLTAGALTAKAIFDPKNSNAPYAFNANLETKKLVFGGRDLGDQRFNMSQSGRTLNFEQNEGDVQALQTTVTREASADCKIKSNGKDPTPGNLHFTLTEEAPCDFLLPTLQITDIATAEKFDVDIGSYWVYPRWGAPDYAHGFGKTPNLSIVSRPGRNRKIMAIGAGKKIERVTLAIDNGFMLAQPDGKVYLLADAGNYLKSEVGNHKWEDVALFWLNSLKSASATFKNAGKIERLAPNSQTVFKKGSVIGLYDDTPDMGGKIDVDSLTKYVVTNNISLNWSIAEDRPKQK